MINKLVSNRTLTEQDNWCDRNRVNWILHSYQSWNKTEDVESIELEGLSFWRVFFNVKGNEKKMSKRTYFIQGWIKKTHLFIVKKSALCCHKFSNIHENFLHRLRHSFIGIVLILEIIFIGLEINFTKIGIQCHYDDRIFNKSETHCIFNETVLKQTDLIIMLCTAISKIYLYKQHTLAINKTDAWLR